MKNAITESQLVLPALMVLSQKQGYVTTSELKKELRKRLTLHVKDTEEVSGGTKRFNKTVGNLISHRTLKPFTKIVKDENGRILMKIKRTGMQKIFKEALNLEA